MINEIDWKFFASMNGLSSEKFFSEITMVAIAAMSMKLDESESNAIKITQGKYTLMLIDNEKE